MPEIPIARQMYNHGASFAKVADDLARQGLGDQPDVQTFAPMIVNATFAVEIFLKALLVQQGNEQQGHKLAMLFDALQAEYKVELQEIGDRLGAQERLPKERFAQRIAGFSNAFIEWRYVYEKQGTVRTMPIKDALVVLHSLEKACQLRILGVTPPNV